MKTAAKWTLAFSLSLAAHAGAAIVFLPDAPPPPLAAVKGGEAMEVALLGNAFEEAIEAGAITEAVSPVESPVEEMAAIAPEPTLAEADPVTPPDPVSPTPPETVTSEADVILPLDAPPPVMTEAPEVVAALPPVATIVPQTRPQDPAAEPPPERKAAARKPVTVNKPAAEAPRKSRDAVASGKEGQAREQANKGRADGSTSGTTTNAGQGTEARSAGNASFTNYEGKVRSRLLRSLRYPSRAESQGAKGVVQVQFVVGANGSVSGIRIAKSAGSPVLDKAALEAARRAAPFPKIPEAAGRSSWPFTIAMEFRR